MAYVTPPLAEDTAVIGALMVERFREKLTTEQLSQRLDRILRDMEGDERA